MTKYEELLSNAQQNMSVIENYQFESDKIKGLYCDGTAALSDKLNTEAEKICVLAEELGHHLTATGDIINQSVTENRKLEMKGRVWAYNRQVGLMGIIDAHKARCTTLYETACYLDVTETFLQESIAYYRSKYGVSACVDNYVIIFEPNLYVIELL